MHRLFFLSSIYCSHILEITSYNLTQPDTIEYMKKGSKMNTFPEGIDECSSSFFADRNDKIEEVCFSWFDTSDRCEYQRFELGKVVWRPVISWLR